MHLMWHEDRFFELVDTGGMGIQDADNLTEHIEEQIKLAIDSAAVILFVVDTRDGLMPLDQEVAKRLRYVEGARHLLANKTDDPSLRQPRPTSSIASAAARPIKVSTMQNRNRAVLLNMIWSQLLAAVAPDDAPGAEPEMKWRSSAAATSGKSTFVNTLAQAERMIVSEIPGTTRDSVDVRFELDGKSVRRHRHARHPPHQEHRSTTSISTAPTAPSAASAGPTWCCCSSTPRSGSARSTSSFATTFAEQYKPCIFVVNKWDQLVE